MKLDSGSKYFEDVTKLGYQSPFPSADSLASDRFQALLSANKGNPSSGDFARWGAKAFVDSLQLTMKNQAVFVGDLLQADLDNPEVFNLVADGAGQVVHGIFASISFPTKMDEATLIRAAADVGFNVAMGVLAKVPVYGTISAGVLRAGYAAGKAFEQWQATRDPPQILPWSEYSRDADEDLVQLFLDHEGQGVDFTPLYLPPFDNEPWQYGRRSTDAPGIIFGPVRGKTLAWNSNYGCIPNTSRVFGQTQASGIFPAGPGNNGASPLRRRAEAPAGVTPKEPIIPWAMDITFCGDWLTSLGQLGLAIWQQCLRPSPMQFRIDCKRLLIAWDNCSANLYETGLDSLEAAAQQLKAGGGGMTTPLVQVVASQLLEPYVAVRRTKMSWPDGVAGEDVEPWVLGMFPNCPRPTPLIHKDFFQVTAGIPGILKPGLIGPVALGQRSAAGWFEQDLPRREWGWPYGQLPKQDTKRLAKWVGGLSADGGRLEGLDAKNPSKGYRATSWPFPEVTAAEYSKLTILTTGAILMLETEQWTTLGWTFDAKIAAGAFTPQMMVCAYVRPDPVGDLPRYGAFMTSDKLRQRCRDAREKLVQLISDGHVVRDYIDLRDVNAIDPPFATRLKNLGVPDVPVRNVPTTAYPTLQAEPLGGNPFGGVDMPKYSLLWGRV